jgi:hypothetical protein
MTDWLFLAVGFLYFCAAMAAFYESKPILGCLMLSWSVGNFCMLMLDSGMR